MEQQRAINALEPFLALSKSANSPRAAADLITKATSAPNTYVFAELLHTPNISALRNSAEFSPYYELLEIFAWGTWADYQCAFCFRVPNVLTLTASANTNLPKLSPQQHQKLLLLSLLPLAKQQSNLSYKSLQEALSIPDQQSLESLITTAIYSSLITGTLDPHHHLINITSVAPLRDLPPESIPSLIQTLATWSAQCTATLSALESQVEEVKAKAKLEGKRQNKIQKIFEEKLLKADEKGKRDQSKAYDEDGEPTPMDVDGGGGGRQTRSSKRSFWSSGSR